MIGKLGEFDGLNHISAITLSVRKELERSDEFATNHGAPQGSVLGPLFCILFTVTKHRKIKLFANDAMR